MKINYINQKARVMSPCLTQDEMLEKMCKIVNVPYTRNKYSYEETMRVINLCVRRGHESVLEHLNITLELVCPIGVYKGLTRHRHCAFTIGSTNYTKYKEADLIMSFEPTEEEQQVIEQLYDLYDKRRNTKEARDLLTQAHAAKVILTTNIRELRYIIGIRLDPAENPLTKKLAIEMWKVLNYTYPFFFPLDNVGDMSMRAIWDKAHNCPVMTYEDYLSKL